MNTLIAISGLGILILLAEIFNARKIIVLLTITGLLAILGYNISQYNQFGTFYNNAIDKTSIPKKNIDKFPKETMATAPANKNIFMAI